MGINLKDVFKNDSESLVIDRKKQAIKLFAIIATVLFVAIIGLMIVRNFGDVDETRRINITRDIRNIQSYVQNKATEAKEDSNVVLPGSPLENNPVTLIINGIAEEYRYGYYLLNPSDTDVQTNLNLPNEQYIVNYDTLDVVNVTGIKYNRKTYHSLDDLVAIEAGQLIPSEHTIIIKVPEDMLKIKQYPSSVFKLAGNIDMSAYSTGEGWEPVQNFSGTFDGRGYTISNLTINRPTQSYVGLFGSATSTAKIANLTFKNVNIIGENYTGVLAGTMAGNISNIIIQNGNVTGEERVGGLVGSHQQGNISKCKVALGTIAGQSQVGGAVGLLNSGTISEVTANTTNIRSMDSAGGFAGSVAATSATFLRESSAISSIDGSASLGGFIGKIEILSDSSLEFKSCYSNGTIREGTENLGGLVGYVRISAGSSVVFDDLYAAVSILNKGEKSGGCIGYSDISIASPTTATDCFWEKNLAVGEILNDVGTRANSTAIISFEDKTYDEMRRRITFSNWDFDIWYIDEFKDTPRLKFENTFKTYKEEIEVKEG